MKAQIKLLFTYLLIIFFSIAISLYSFEIYLNMINKHSGYEKIISEYFNKTGKKYDERTKLEAYNDLKKKDNDIYVSMYPMAHLLSKNSNIFPLSGVSNVKSIHCNENGYYSQYLSDRYGFNNPDKEWDSDEIDFILIGDSYTHGACVNRPNDFASVLRKISNKNVLNLGFTGNGPLIEYATLKEYLNKKVKNVIWIYYAGNDLIELDRELKNSILTKYLDEKFSQNLISKQKEIDLLNKKIISQLVVDTNFQNIKKNSRLKYKILKFMQLDKTKDKIRVLLLKPNYKMDNLDTFKEILIKSKSLIHNNNSKLYFVYLPDYDIFRNKFHPKNHEKIIRKFVEGLDIPFISIQEKFFSNKANPLEYYPFNTRHHFTPEGYFEIAKTIYKEVNK